MAITIIYAADGLSIGMHQGAWKHFIRRADGAEEMASLVHRWAVKSGAFRVIRVSVRFWPQASCAASATGGTCKQIGHRVGIKVGKGRKERICGRGLQLSHAVWMQEAKASGLFRREEVTHAFSSLTSMHTEASPAKLMISL